MNDYQPIGYVRNQQKELYQLPYQIGILDDMEAVIELGKGQNFEAALDGLQDMERVWVIFSFHRANNWKPKVYPPRGGQKRGLFATRSPHRPNAIGFSAVKLKRIDGLCLYIEDHDLLDGTPVLDIKPYLPYVDSFPDSKCGWLEKVAVPQIFEIRLSELIQEQLNWLLLNNGYDLLALSSVNLRIKPFPEAGNRIKELSENTYEMAMKTWRLIYTVENDVVCLQKVKSGYDAETLAGDKKSRWDDVPLHRQFLEKFI
ncbi:MAG: tRNA (N6-threonylcarbamoyladenosine(37)-N6)-methyltransferase TrmO [Lentisphaeraceae bacterium]|nr:tRNA (N6-threonylcarbamoyladenosine(37)-N6)-methyltransferase TrmO [Lentisphaeraceae bacterium]